ncbi:MAG: sulfur carrier protein ThiS [Betaproteobacteria bacterium]
MREGDDVFAPTRAAQASASVKVNGHPHPWRLGLTVADVLAERDTDGASVATAVNGSFVPREERAETPLWPDDTLIAFSAIVGG